VHGKPTHEETRATFSHAAANTATVIVNDMEDAIRLSKYITGEKPLPEFYAEFKGRYSENFDAENDLQRIGVVNQTTMLASDTQAIADFLMSAMVSTYELTESNKEERFAETRDTLCYATNDNQSAVYGLLQEPADFAIVVGGYNSSNTSHLVELCEQRLPTFFINDAEKIISETAIKHFDFHHKQELITNGYLPEKNPVKILITSGASCPDALVEEVIKKIVSFFEPVTTVEKVVAAFA
jgi:4-hydroxy-3-methylbut-2-enyl diphosphate reductase